jgi:purine-binding chemotaxis protein CheW
MNDSPWKNDLDFDFSVLLDSPSLNGSTFPAVDSSAADSGEKYVVFHLEEKLYAVHSEQVIEVIGFLPVSSLPLVPDWLTGIANVRGEIISVVDLRRLWKKSSPAPAKNKFLILRSKKENQTVAFVIDKLSEIITLAASEIEFSAADFEASFPTFFGRAQYGSQTVFLLDAESLFSSLGTGELQAR